MVKVISFCLWGNDPEYCVGAIRNAEMAKEVYPGWETWFYVHENVETATTSKLKELSSKVITYTGSEDADGMFQRFLPMLESNVDIFISRDCDSRLSDKEYQAVRDWEDSAFQFHSLKDHPAHENPPVLGGMWGAKRHGFLNLNFINSEIATFKSGNYGDDQKGLHWLYTQASALFKEHGNSKHWYPKHTPIVYGSFIGERITAEDTPGRV